MTDQHRATPEQWDIVDNEATDGPSDHIYSCILELRARVEALEAKYETQRLATLEWGKDVDNHSRWIDDHLKRIMALEAAQRPRPAPAAGRFDGVEWKNGETYIVSEAIIEPSGADSLVESIEARAGGDGRTALRVVAAWMQERTGTIANGSQWADMLRAQSEQ
jgi:hypothetical protein